MAKLAERKSGSNPRARSEAGRDLSMCLPLRSTASSGIAKEALCMAAIVSIATAGCSQQADEAKVSTASTSAPAGTMPVGSTGTQASTPATAPGSSEAPVTDPPPTEATTTAPAQATTTTVVKVVT